MKKPESGNNVIIIILVVFLTMGAGTFIHDPVLHSIIAYLNGWEIGEYSSGLMTGQTTVIATAASAAGASTFGFWLFFMFPSIFIFIATLIISILKPERIVLVSGIILISLNLPSLHAGITGSDAHNAIQFLTTRGWTEASAYAAHYLIFVAIIAVWGMYLYIAVENNMKDARSRAGGLLR